MFQRKNPYNGKIELVEHIYVNSPNDIPNVEHFAVIYGDTRRYLDSYGDGYSNFDFVQYIAYANEEGLRKFILNEAQNQLLKKHFKVIYVKPVEIQLSTTINIKN